MDKLFASFLFFCACLLVFIVTLPVYWLYKILFILLGYYLLMFVVSRLFIPRLGFWKERLPRRLPGNLRREVIKLKGNKEQVLRKAYKIVTSKFYGLRGYTLLYMSKMMWRNPSLVWRRGGFAQCSTQTYFLRLFLVKSGKFKDEDIEVYHHPLGLNIHQILRVKVGKKKVFLDPWAKKLGIPFGRRIDYFFKYSYDPKKYEGIYVKE